MSGISLERAYDVALTALGEAVVINKVQSQELVATQSALAELQAQLEEAREIIPGNKNV